MATGTRNKRTTQQEIKAKLNARVNQQAGHLAALANHVDSITEAKVGAAKQIEELKQLGLTLKDIEETTSISVYRLSTFTREARQYASDTGGTDTPDNSAGESETASDSKPQEGSEEITQDSDDRAGDPIASESESARP